MNSLFAAFGALSWKAYLAPLLLPPVPLLLLLWLGWRLRQGGRVLAGTLVLTLAVAGLWFGHCRITGDWLESRWLKPPPPLAAETLPTLRRSLGPRPVLVILGGGREPWSAEYGDSTLTDRSLQRLAYGLWLSRRLDAPVLFSGGVGRSESSDQSEASIAARTAERDFGRPLRWTEGQSADTRDNARLSLPLLANHGATDLILVTHAWHMPRALRAFREAAEIGGLKLRILPAPLGTAASGMRPALDWMPSAEGHRKVRDTLRELVGLLAGA